MQACGRHALPRRIEVAARTYTLTRVFKHDFFACTALYQGPADGAGPVRLVLKIARAGDFLGLPLAWLGRWLGDHEWDILSTLQGLDNVPKLVSRYGPTGFIYEYIEGQSLDETPHVRNDKFFDQLAELITQLHRRRIVYLDMNKRGNILAGPDGRPNLIDFQISAHIGRRILGAAGLADWILDRLGREDYYHLNKHKRRIRKDLMTPSELTRSRNISGAVAFHRKVFRPLTRLRRLMLRHLFHHGHLLTDETAGAGRESDPRRWDP